LRDSAGLVRLPLIDARIWCARTVLRVVLLFVDMPARLILFMVQIATLGASQGAVGYSRSSRPMSRCSCASRPASRGESSPDRTPC